MNRAQRRAAERQQAKAEKKAQNSHALAAARASASTRGRRLESPSTDRPADRAAKLALIEQFDGFAPLRNGLKRVAKRDDLWAGVPMPLTDERLVIEPRYPNAEALSKIGAKDDEPLPDGVRERNAFWSRRLRQWVVIWDEGGKILHGKFGSPHHITMDIHTLGCSDAWGIEQEANAINLLATLVSHRQFKHYLVTGMFLETSKRSKLTYLFRRLKPTVCLDARDQESKSGTRILAALCMHPIGYYRDTWAGAMCPTDDVVAHLMMMRGDEHMYWKRCNQIAPDRPEAGL